MVLAGNDEIQRVLRDIIERQTKIDKRVERLETLEFEKYAKSDGCIRWLDYDIQGAVGSVVVDLPANPYELGDYGWTHYTAFYAVGSTSAGDKTLHLTFNAVAANYGYTYKYARGGAQTIISADGQTSIVIANLRGTLYTLGWIHVPFFPIPFMMHTYGDWVCRDSTQEAGFQVEKGEYGGLVSTGAARITRLTLTPSAGNINGYIYLYGWCPTWDIASGPPD